MIELSNLEEMVALRRDLHAHPELCYDEHRTAAVIAARLREWGIEVHTGIAKTGVVGTIRAGNSGRAIALRADMDALPMREENTFAHRSQHDGKMHGCGHDGHTAMLLAAARHLQQTRRFDGIVHLVFQPAEEGGAGGRAMLEDGLFERFPSEAVFGMHNWPGMPAGSFGVRPGPMMAASNVFRITVRGKGGHAAAPQDCQDPIPALLQIGQALQTIITRNRRPIDSVVLSITQLQAGTTAAFNVIPGEAVLGGALRAYSIDVVDLVEKRMREIADLTARSFGCEAEVHFERRYPALVNSPKETEFCLEVMRELHGASADQGNVSIVEPVMAAEDFAFMLQAKPGCYVFIGNGDGAHRASGHGLGPCMLHNASYDFNDTLIPIGAAYWVRLVERYLAQPASQSA
jgi:amidohydrolase